jgi:tryptophan halogenase
MLGQGIMPSHYHYMTRAMSDQDLKRFLDGIRGSVNRALEGMPAHQDFLNHYCKASDDIWGMAKPATPAM